MLADFPWGTPASKANAVAMLFTPHLRPYLGALSPLFAVNSSQPGNGKGLLCTVAGTPHGMTTQTMADNTEMRKTIPTLLGDNSAPAIVLDNIEKPLRSPDLAAVLTMKYWSSRFLSRNKLGTFLNDRTWIGNGNQLQLAGDMPRRSAGSTWTIPTRIPPHRPCREHIRHPPAGRRISPTVIGYISDRSNLQVGLTAMIVAVALSAVVLFYGMCFAPRIGAVAGT